MRSKPKRSHRSTIRDDQGNSVKLAKLGSGWALADAEDYPADATKITPILDKLVAIKTNRLATQTAASHARLQVADDKFVRRVELATAGGANKTLYLGSSGGGSSTHVRLAGQNEVYLASGLATWDINADAGSWVDTAYFTVPQADVVGVTLANANGQWTFAKDAQGAWSMADLAAGETFNAGSVTSLLSQASAIRMTRPLGKSDQAAYGLSKPGAVLTLKTRKDNQEKVYTLTVGAKDAKDSSYVVKSSESAYYARVAEYTVSDLVGKKRDGFLQLPPTVAPVGTPRP